MPKSDAAAKASGMLSDLKSRLGFDKGDGRDRSYDDFDDFNEYSDFDDDGFSASNDREYAGYGADYDEHAPVGAYRPATTRSSRFGRPDSSPDLVSINDVKARTQVPDGLLRDPLAPEGSSHAPRQSSGRSLVENSGPAHSSPAYNAQARSYDSHSRSEGLDSLFEPTSTGAASGSHSAGSTRSTGSYDPYEAYSSSLPSRYTSTRGLTVVKPTAYADAEQVSRALKAGDVVVLVMRETSDDLSKRILDFSFGAASALDANVECPAEKVFAIARGQALTESEKLDLRTQGAY